MIGLRYWVGLGFCQTLFVHSLGDNDKLTSLLTENTVRRLSVDCLLGSSLMLWIVVHEPFFSLLNISPCCFISL